MYTVNEKGNAFVDACSCLPVTKLVLQSPCLPDPSVVCKQNNAAEMFERESQDVLQRYFEFHQSPSVHVFNVHTATLIRHTPRRWMHSVQVDEEGVRTKGRKSDESMCIVPCFKPAVPPTRLWLYCFQAF